MRNILILGGTGAMGTPLSAILSKQGENVFVTSRQKQGLVDGINYLQGNAHEFGFMNELLKKQWDAIVDFMNYGSFEFEQRYRKILSSTKHYLFLSSARVYADSVEPITEKSERLLDISPDKDYLSTDEYALHKAREENMLINSGYDNFTIIRPYITYNDERLQLGVLEKEMWAYRLLKHRTILFSKDIESHITTLTYGADVAYCISRLINNDKAYGEIFHITTDQYIKWGEVLNLYCDVYKKVTGETAKIKLIDKALNLDNDIAKYQVLYDRYYDRIFDNSKILSIVQDFSFTDIKSGLSRCFKTFLTTPSFKYISLSDEEKRNLITGEYLHLGEISGKKNKIRYLIGLSKRML